LHIFLHFHICSIILEVVADQSLWLWHFHFVLLHANNNINVLDGLHFILDMFWGVGNDLSFEVNGHCYLSSLLVGPRYLPKVVGICANCSWIARGGKEVVCIVAKGNLERHWTMLWSVVISFRHNTKFCKHWDSNIVSYIFHACAIIHNMIIEDD